MNVTNSLNDLMKIWKNKKPSSDGKINHSKNVFIPDGIVSEEHWNKSDIKILFVLKEAYSKDKKWNNLLGYINDGAENHKMWKRISEWCYGIFNTTTDKIPPYDEACNHMDILKSIAVLNIKKSAGKESSNGDEIREYALFDREEIKEEIRLINPDIIVCGGTFSVFDEIYDGLYTEKNKLWYYYSEKLCDNNVLIIDYYHPSNHYPKLLNYYGIVGIYQKSLIEKYNKSNTGV